MKSQKTTKSITALIAMASLMAWLSAVSLPAVATARPLAHHAQNRVENRVDSRIDARIANVQDRISLGKRTHQLSQREASRLSGKLNDIKSLKRGYERSGRGLNGQETATLNARLDTLSGQIRVQANDHNRR